VADQHRPTGGGACTLAGDGYATLRPDGSYKLAGEAGNSPWWAIELCRFAPGVLNFMIGRDIAPAPLGDHEVRYAGRRRPGT
jgi:hypothetical protein